EGGSRSALHQEGARRAPGAGRGRGHFVRGVGRNGRQDGVRPVDPAGPDRGTAAAHRLAAASCVSQGAPLLLQVSWRPSLTPVGKSGILLMLNDFSPYWRTVFKVRGGVGI